MTIKEIIDGLQMTINLFLFDSETGEDLSKEQLNDLGRTTVEACEGAIKLIQQLPSAEPESKTGRWIDCSTPPDDDRSVFIARGKNDFMSVCIGHYDHDSKLWYEDRNWFAKPMYDEMLWTEIPDLPTDAQRWKWRMNEQDRAIKARREEDIKALQEMRSIMLEDDNWENLKRFIHAVTVGGMALQRLNVIDFGKDGGRK